MGKGRSPLPCTLLYMPTGSNDPLEIGHIGSRDCNSCRGGAPHLLTTRARRGKSWAFQARSSNVLLELILPCKYYRNSNQIQDRQQLIACLSQDSNCSVYYLQRILLSVLATCKSHHQLRATSFGFTSLRQRAIRPSNQNPHSSIDPSSRCSTWTTRNQCGP